jgi:hypothetical protein
MLATRRGGTKLLQTLRLKTFHTDFIRLTGFATPGGELVYACKPRA